MLGLAALAIDVSYWQVGATQLQTGADAAALAGARAAQLYPTNAATMSVQYAQGVANQNVAFGNAVALPGSAVEPVRWNPALPPSTTNPAAASWTGTGTGAANAVRVTVQAQPTSILAGVTSAGRPTVRRSAVAWIANVNSGCIKPFALPYSVLYNKSAALAGMSASTAASPPDLEQRQLTAIASASQSSRIVILRGPNTADADARGASLTAPPAAPTFRGNDGPYAAYSFTGNAGGPQYRTSIPDCRNVSTTVDGGTTLPGGNDLECHTIQGLMGASGNCNGGGWPRGATSANGAVCVLKPATGTPVVWDAGCYTATNTLGRALRVAWGDNIGNGSNAVNYRVVGEFVLLCAFRGSFQSFGETETCDTGQVPAPAQLPRGTLVGILQGLSTPS
jgi:hypothetical protein